MKGRTPTALGKISTSGHEVLAPNLDAELTYAMEQVITSGTGVAANIGRPAAGKTGTAENYQDAWFCGFVPQLATCVWVGYPAGEIPLLDVEGVGEVYGGTLPAEIWREFMEPAVANLPVKPLPGTFGDPLPQFGAHVLRRRRHVRVRAELLPDNHDDARRRLTELRYRSFRPARDRRG